jgi:hypothetical protein
MAIRTLLLPAVILTACGMPNPAGRIADRCEPLGSREARGRPV